MRFARLGTVLLASAALLLTAGVAKAGFPIDLSIFDLGFQPDRLNGCFEFLDDTEGDDNSAGWWLDSTDFDVFGQATGTGLNNDIITLEWDPVVPDNAKATGKGNGTKGTAKVQQKTQTSLEVCINGDPCFEGEPPKCKTSANMKGLKGADSENFLRSDDTGDKGRVTVTCTLGTGLSALTNPDSQPPGAVPTEAQVNSILAAFENRKDVQINQKNGKLKVKHKGTYLAPTCGDGNLALCEECDDGNTVDNDGCSATCEIELNG